MPTPTTKAWRIVTPQRAGAAFDGEGAKKFGGRWNRPGTAMVYTASSLALAAMEMLVHLESEELLAEFVAIPIEIPVRYIETLPEDQLPASWRDDPVPPETQALGSDWARATCGRRSCAGRTEPFGGTA